MGVGGDEGLSEQLCSQLSGQSVNDYLQTILLFVSSDLEERFHGLGTEWGVLAQSPQLGCVVWGWERAVVSSGEAKGRKCRGVHMPPFV